MAGAVSSDSFKSNFIDSYVGNVSVQDNDEMKRLIGIRSSEAEAIATQIINNTEKIVKSNNIKSSDFAYAILLKKLENKDGFKDLLNSDGTPLNIEKLSGLLNKHIEIQVNMQNEQKEVQENLNLEQPEENNKLSEEELKESLGKIDFKNLSNDDMILITYNYIDFLRNADKEQKDAFKEEFLKGQEEKVQEKFNEWNDIVDKIVNEIELTPEEEKFIQNKGFASKKEFIKSKENVMRKFANIEVAVKDNDKVDEIIKYALESKEFCDFLETTGIDLDIYIKGIKERSNKTKEKNSEEIQGKNSDNNGESREELTADETEVFLNNKFEGLEDFAKTYIEEIGENDVVEEQDDFGFDFDSGFESLNETEQQQQTQNLKEAEQQQQKEDESIIDEVSTFEVKENPLKKLFSRIFTRKLEAAKEPIPGNPTQRPIDLEEKRGLLERISDAYTDWRNKTKTAGEALKSIVVFRDNLEKRALPEPKIKNQPNKLIEKEKVDIFKQGITEETVKNTDNVSAKAAENAKKIIIPGQSGKTFKEDEESYRG